MRRRRTASEVIRHLENRIARLEREADSGGIVGGVGINLGSSKADTASKTWTSATAFFQDVSALADKTFYNDDTERVEKYSYIEAIYMGQDYDTGIKDSIMFVARNNVDGWDMSGDPYIVVSKGSLLYSIIKEDENMVNILLRTAIADKSHEQMLKVLLKNEAKKGITKALKMDV